MFLKECCQQQQQPVDAQHRASYQMMACKTQGLTAASASSVLL
jgi:hypothetical protein